MPDWHPLLRFAAGTDTTTLDGRVILCFVSGAVVGVVGVAACRIVVVLCRRIKSAISSPNGGGIGGFGRVGLEETGGLSWGVSL